MSPNPADHGPTNREHPTPEAKPSPQNSRGSTGKRSPSGRDNISWESVVRNTALVVVVLVMLWLLFNVELPPAEQLQERIEAFGWVSWLVFIGLYALVALTPIPVTIMAVAGGLIFGVVLGSVFSVIGVFIGSWGAYWLARALGTEAVRKVLGKYSEKIESRLDGAGFEAVCTLRLVPGIPYWPVNYGSGAFGITQRDFLPASLIAVIPGQVSLVSLGAFVADPTFIHGAVVVVSWIVVLVMTVWAYKRWKAARE